MFIFAGAAKGEDEVDVQKAGSRKLLKTGVDLRVRCKDFDRRNSQVTLYLERGKAQATNLHSD